MQGGPQETKNYLVNLVTSSSTIYNHVTAVATKGLLGHGPRMSDSSTALLHQTQNATIARKVFLEAAEGECQGKQPHHFYMVCTTANKTVILTEKLADGSTTWVVNPKNLEDRNSLAKQVFKSECVEHATVKDVKTQRANFNRPMDVDLSIRKQYVRAVFKQLTGKTFKGKWGGFIRRYAGPSVFLGRPSMEFPINRPSGLGNGSWTSKKK